MNKTQSNAMTDFVKPIAVLVIICAVMSLLLGFTNQVTAPIIAEAEAEAERQAQIEVLPSADSFIQAELAGMPESVTKACAAENGTGWVFSLTAQGYGGKGTLKMAVGIDMDGKITGVKVLSHKETAGLGSKITSDANFYGQFPGLDAEGAANADTISGATFSSRYYKAAIADAFTAFGMVTG